MTVAAPVTSSTRKYSTLSATRTLVTVIPPEPVTPPAAPQRERICPRVTTVARVPRAFCSLMHSGQRKPTGAGIMHSWQMGRPQLEQDTPVSRRGCR